jgi:hypothetical protein
MKLILLSLLALPAFALTCPSGFTEIADSQIVNAVTGAPYVGSLTLTQTANSLQGTSSVLGDQQTYQVTAGAIDFCLSPGRYAVRQRGSGSGLTIAPAWIVPSSGGPYRITDIPTGTVNTAGTVVTSTGGINFAAVAASDNVFIAALPYSVCSIQSATALTLCGTGAGTQTGVSFSDGPIQQSTPSPAVVAIYGPRGQPGSTGPAGVTSLGTPVTVVTSKTLTIADNAIPQEITGSDITISAPASLGGLLAAGYAVSLRKMDSTSFTVSGNGSQIYYNGTSASSVTIPGCSTAPCPSILLSINAAGTGYVLVGLGVPGAAGQTGPPGPTGATGIGSPTFTQALSAVTTSTVLAATHLQGASVAAFCFDNSTPANAVACSYTVSSSGNVAFTFGSSFTGYVEIIGSGSGPAGPAGATGPLGATGPSGGPAGATGPAGAQGPAGATGPAGAAGVAGPTGPAGDVGATGPAGGPSGASLIAGTANFSDNGTIQNLVASGCVTGVTRLGSGNYDLTLSSCPSNFFVSVSGGAPGVAFTSVNIDSSLPFTNSSTTLNITMVSSSTSAAVNAGNLSVIITAATTGSSDSSLIAGTANFSDNGTIQNLVVSGCVTGVTRLGSGNYNLVLSSCPNNFSASLSAGAPGVAYTAVNIESSLPFNSSSTILNFAVINLSTQAGINAGIVSAIVTGHP